MSDRIFQKPVKVTVRVEEQARKKAESLGINLTSIFSKCLDAEIRRKEGGGVAEDNDEMVEVYDDDKEKRIIIPRRKFNPNLHRLIRRIE